ncbi:MAG: phosphatidate cytidylyltransferase [Novosphingobium sp.]
MTEPQPQPKKSDLGVRTASAVVMVAVAGTALWLGGWWWTVFVAAVAIGVLWEWWGLVLAITNHVVKRGAWLVAGLLYVGVAAATLWLLRNGPPFVALPMLGVVVLAVIFTDIGAYFVGRMIGGPKIAPSISPSKTWSGLLGGMAGSGVAVVLVTSLHEGIVGIGWKLGVGAMLAIIAQSGDFFESWMKRCAGVKDSGSLIPGHGGLFDRVDGLLAVCFVIGVMSLALFGGILLSGGSLLPNPV